MGEEAPKSKESKEGAPLFEEFEQKVGEALGLMRTIEFLNPQYGYRRRQGPIRKLEGEYRGGDQDRYEADLDAVKHIPEFRDLIEQEQEILTSGASKEEIAQYNNIYQRVYERREEVLKSLEQKLEDLRRAYRGSGQAICESARLLFGELQKGRSLGWELKEALLRDKLASLQRNMESVAKREKIEQEQAALQKQFGERYRKIMKNAQAALTGEKMLVELKVMNETAQLRGFKDSQEMWPHDLEALQKLKEEVGKDGFKQLEYMNRT